MTSDTGPSDEAARHPPVCAVKGCDNPATEKMYEDLPETCSSCGRRGEDRLLAAIASLSSTDGDVEGLAFRLTDDEAGAIYDAREVGGDGPLYAVVERILNDRLTQRDAALVSDAEARVGERIAEAIEAMLRIATVTQMQDELVTRAAAIARATGSET